MKFRFAGIAAACAMALVGCGGGGSGGATSTQVTSLVTLTEANAKAVAANALYATYGGTSQTAPGPIALLNPEANTLIFSPNSFERGVGTQREAVRGSFPVSATYTIDQTVSCAYGGSKSYKGTSSVITSNFVTGDFLETNYKNCVEGTAQTNVIRNGVLETTFTKVAGAYDSTIDLKAKDLSAKTGTQTVVVNGDQTVSCTNGYNSCLSISRSGSVWQKVVTRTGSTAVRRFELQDYSYSFSSNLTQTTGTYSLNGKVIADQIAKGDAGGVYTIQTGTSFVNSVASGVISSGALSVTGANGAQVRVTATGNDTFSVALDLNGDGTFEKTLSSSWSEFTSLIP